MTASYKVQALYNGDVENAELVRVDLYNQIPDAGEERTMARAGLNGNFHGAFDVEQRLVDLGAQYDGDGDWTLAEGLHIEATSAEDWLLTTALGGEWHVWTEE